MAYYIRGRRGGEGGDQNKNGGGERRGREGGRERAGKERREGGRERGREGTDLCLVDGSDHSHGSLNNSRTT